MTQTAFIASNSHQRVVRRAPIAWAGQELVNLAKLLADGSAEICVGADSGNEGGRMSLFRRGDVWWYEFIFAGRRVRESSKSPSKTVARKLRSSSGSVNSKRASTTSLTIGASASEQSLTWPTSILTAYKLRHPQSAVFAEYAVNHV